jgi:cell division protein FtsB
MARDGRTTKVPVALPQMESAPEHWLRNIRLSGFAFTVLALVVLSVVVLAPSLRILVEQQQQIAELRAAVEEKRNAVDELEDNVARWDDPAYIESQARDRLNYVYPRDYTYLVIDDGQTVQTSDGAPISGEIQETQVDWMASLVDSVFTAGLTDATASELESPTFGDK